MGHTLSDLLVHVIFSTKDRQPTITADFRPRLYEYMAGVAKKEIGVALRIGGTADHIHGLLAIRPEVSVAEAMRKWKALSSKWIHATFPASRSFGWQAGYGAFTVSRSVAPRVIEYIDDQEEHHKTVTFQEEFLAFLKRHRIEYDPRFIWN